MARGEKGKASNKDAPAYFPDAAVSQQLPPLGDEFTMPAREIRIPGNQLQLSDVQLDEETAKMLTANNPHAPKALVRYIQKEKCYKPEAMIAQTVTHFAMDGWLLQTDSEDTKKQQERVKVEEELQRKFTTDVDKAGHGADAVDDSKELRNRFNFSERAAQTSSLHPKSKATATEPPPTLSISGSCCQSVVYDEYSQDQERLEAQERAAKAKAAAKKGIVSKQEGDLIKAAHQEQPPLLSSEVALAAKTLERMVNQNTFADIGMDFKYWEDVSDAYRPRCGTLLPLWKFTNERARRKSVTAIAWSPMHRDVFAVAYGSYDFMRPTTGLVCVFALANPTYPEVAFPMDAGALALAFHPQHASLLALGLYDGTVAVCDMSRPLEAGGPVLCRSAPARGGHSEPVWQVAWEVADGTKTLQMYSVSSDGRVLLWTVSKSSLEPEVAMTLHTGASVPEGGPALRSGSCFDFNQINTDVYVVGTEEGTLHKCSKAYASEYLASFYGHSMAVYSVRWNCIHPTVFLSASADWTVRLWDASKDSDVVMTFDMNTCVGDVAWAPYSSTVFAVATSDGKVSVFDLAQNQHEPICSQKIVRKGALTKIAFNPKHPILLVGDDRGCVTSLKLSPNLRLPAQPQPGQTVEAAEIGKLNEVVDIALKTRVAVRAKGVAPDTN